MKLKDKKSFSLIELLCVIAIAAVLMAVVVPAFFNMIRGQGVEIATREIGSKLKAVRTYAISQRQYVALVFIASESTTNNDRYCYKSCRPCKVSYQLSDETWQWQSWVPDEKWDILPIGVVVRSLDTSLAATAGTFIDTKSNKVEAVKDSNVFSAASRLSAIIFKPTGEIAGNRIYVTVGQGSYQNSSLQTQNASNSATITVDQYTGRISYGNQ